MNDLMGFRELDFANLKKMLLKIMHIFLFILAYFFYIDGVGTIISVSTSYGSKLGLSAPGAHCAGTGC